MNIFVNKSKIENIDLVVFDKDGTLIDLHQYWVVMIKLRAEKMCDHYGLSYEEHRDPLMEAMGIDCENQKISTKGPVGKFARAKVQQAAEIYLVSLGCDKVRDVCFEVFALVDNLSIPLLPQLIRPLTGVTELILRIKQNEGIVAIATSDKTQRAQLAMEFIGLADQVDLIVGSDLVNEGKPAPETLNLIQDKLKISPEKSVMIGDAETDIEMGQIAGYKANIGISTGLKSQEELSAYTPYVVEDASQIAIV
ncbi:HAD family hydrolase [Candidatus Auribacterota bacterium]